jgi:glycosyltransferase involved in cell wall biosynthesis
MKVVVFGNSCGLGGAQTAFRHMVEFFVNDGHEVGVIGLIAKDDVLPAHEKSAFGLRVNHVGWRLLKFGQIIRAAQRARSFTPDLFVSVGLATSANVLARYLRRPTFRLCQDFIFGRALNDPLLKPLHHTFHALAVQSPSMVGALRSQGFDALPLSWLPCFPDPPQPGFSRTNRNGRPEIRLGYFGRLAANKGIDFLLQSLATAKLPAPVSLDIWGGGGELQKLRQLSERLSLGSIVQFRGRYPEGTDYARLMCGYDGLVLPSTDTEGLPLVLLEAMAYGVPFLTTRVGAIPDCANEDAVLVEPNLDGVRVGLEQFVARVAADQFSTSRLQKHFAVHFSHDVMAARWREMIIDPKLFFSVRA